MGFEPTTASLEGWNSTTELRPPTRNQLSSPYRLRRTATGGRNFIARFMTGYVRIRTIGSVTQLSSSCSRQLDVVGRQGFEPWKP